ncbi:MAG: ABC transporter permease [Ardenticatenaceae bacterium]|nr:ABC transporter permease [Anaerolineales bacterium]MCB8921117.1 ABC transporter permease [Ardenticatenaceae bacterium]MCB8990822.1 ABC transporter permease [Ardenticatenaceae bacterium]MCB9004484.1 ABC transporter permease [Ardenticatenaceae bacterium]
MATLTAQSVPETKATPAEKRRLLLLMGPPVLALLLFFLLPLGVMALYTFQTGTLGGEMSWSLETYGRFWENTALHRLLWRSTVVSFQTSLLCILLSYPIAYYLVFRAGDRRMTLLTLIIIPAWTSYLLRILAWKLILGTEGLLNTFLLWAGWVDEPSPILLFSKTAVIVTLVYVWVPFVALPIFAALERMDKRLLEAAADLGSPPWYSFLRVTLPLSMPGVLAGFLSVFIPTLGEYVTPLLVGGVNGIMYGNLIQDQFVRALNWPLGSLMSLVMLVALLPLFLLFRKSDQVLQ